MNVTTAEREWLNRINNKPVGSKKRRQPAIEVALHIDRNIPVEKKGKGFSNNALSDEKNLRYCENCRMDNIPVCSEKYL